MKITYIGHACFLIEDNAGHTLVTDPYKSGYVPGLADHNVTADEVICSHGHGDHNDSEGVRKPFETWDGRFDIKTVHTFHDDVGGAARGRNDISIINVDGLRIVHMGDIGCELTESQLDDLRNCDVLMIPVGGFFTIDARQACEMTMKIDPKVVIPMHFRGKTFGYDEISTNEEFIQLITSEGSRRIIKDTSVIEKIPDDKCMFALDPAKA